MNYDILLSFGCSFTEGGGLNAKEYHKYIKSNIDIQDQKVLNLYALNHSYPFYLSKLLGCDFINFGISRGSNEYIFSKVYKECLKYLDKKILVTVQTSILSRMLLHSADDDNFEYNVNSYETNFSKINSYYKMYLKHFYNEKKEFNKLIMMADLLQAWLKAKGIDFVFIAWDIPHGESPKEHFLLFPGPNGSGNNFGDQEKILISHLPGITFMDRHLSEKGNECVAKIIYDYIRKTYD